MVVNAMSRALSMVALVGAFCGSVIVMGAWAKLTDMCRTGDAAYVGRNNPNLVDNPDESQAYNCGITLSLEWFIIFLEFFTVIFAFISVATPGFFSKYFIMFSLAVATTLFCDFARDTVQTTYLNMGNENKDSYAQSNAAAAAGAIILLTCNFLFMMMYGHETVVTTAVPVETKAHHELHTVA